MKIEHSFARLNSISAHHQHGMHDAPRHIPKWLLSLGYAASPDWLGSVKPDATDAEMLVALFPTLLPFAEHMAAEPQDEPICRLIAGVSFPLDGAGQHIPRANDPRRCPILRMLFSSAVVDDPMFVYKMTPSLPPGFACSLSEGLKRRVATTLAFYLPTS